ncbi:MAG TPA: bile acid:sodium symporter family protein [Tenuifilaceae bacterium]|nr:bile acid:sodium symporter family protein [Tenuifilaceae bacterium]HPE19425.1 bile acid:sodium symporter family protein [Tenuifilaceae bacterium]HPJ46782.1 bile acid:sodium symporter family protein [Tenuifilaceae bacterium]HPQ35475.1 bile acid:sodium symporter family protein [Tenuifilaceae bacterium]HRX68434.1 bile acid:sodium symporter family protein [Tenuifilaceae bacterium]
MFELLRGIDTARLNFSEGGLLFMNITLAVIMFGVALEIKTDHFKNILNYPKSFILGFGAQFLILPALTFLLVIIIRPPASVAMGMILISACPGGNISNFISSLSKANVALSVSLTAAATLFATILTPLNYSIYGNLFVEYSERALHLNIPIEIDFWQMAQTVFILLGIPLILGMWVGHRFPVFTAKYVKSIKIGSVILYLIFIFGALYANLGHFGSIIIPIGILVLLLNAQTLFSGFLVGTIGRVPRADRRTLSIETGIQNSGLALVLIFNPKLFDGNGGMAFMAAWWGIWQMISGLLLAWLLSRIKIPKTKEAMLLVGEKNQKKE